jgi:hypothetical protein
MLRLDRIEKIRVASYRGLLRAYTTHQRYRYRRVVIVPEAHPTFWDDPTNCDEYGFQVGFRREWVWHTPFGKVHEIEPAILIDTAPNAGMIIFRHLMRPTLYPTIAERIIEAENAGLFSTITRGNREYGVVLSREAFSKRTVQKSDFIRFGEPIAQRNSQGIWETISGYSLAEVAPEVQL